MFFRESARLRPLSPHHLLRHIRVGIGLDPVLDGFHADRVQVIAGAGIVVPVAVIVFAAHQNSGSPVEHASYPRRQEGERHAEPAVGKIYAEEQMNFDMPKAVFCGLALIAAAIYFGPESAPATAEGSMQKTAICEVIT